MNIIGIAGRREDGSSAGSGKDEVAKTLAAKHGFVVVSFADEIKRTAMRWYDFTPDQLWGSKKEEPDLRYPREHGPWDITGHCVCCGYEAEYSPATHKWFATSDAPQCFLNPRFVLRFLGTEAGRMFWFDTWVSLTIKIAKELLTANEHVYYEKQVGLVYEYREERRAEGVVIPDVRWPAANEGQVIKAAKGKLWLVERPGTSQKGAAVAKHDSETQPIPREAFDVIIRNDRGLEELAHGVDEAMMARKVGVHP